MLITNGEPDTQRWVSPVPREGVGNLPVKAVRRLCPTLRAAPFRYRPPDAGKLGVFASFEPIRHRPGRTGEEHCTIRKQLPPQYPSVPADDHQAGRSLAGGVTMGVIMDRFWAMPSKYTFEIKPIRELLMQYIPNGLVIDPFANKSRIASVTNDLDTDFDTDFHLDATDFLSMFKDSSVDMVLYDPPYSARQVSECYRKMGYTVNMQTTQNSYWRKHKEQIRRIVKPNGLVLSCGWNSGGIGKKYGFEPLHIRLVAHGGNHNDTIVVVERRVEN